MPIDRSQTQPASLPPTDHVARELLKRGARTHAMAFLRAAIERDPGERACAALLRAVEARPDASVYGPDVALNLALVDGYVRSGMLVEALAVLRGGKLELSPAGAERARLLDELLAPIAGDSEPALVEAYRQILGGSAVLALGTLEDRAKQGPMPDWATSRQALLRRILLEELPVAASIPPAAADADTFGTSPHAQIIARGIERRDLPGALAELRKHVQASPGELEAKAACDSLGRLVAGMLQAERDQAIADRTARTMPMQGHHVAQLHLRMANLAEAERIFRKLVLERPLDQVARQRLDDLQTVRKVVHGPLRESQPGLRVSKPPADVASAPTPAPPTPSAPAAPARRIDPFKETAAGAPGVVPLGDQDVTRPVMLPEGRRYEPQPPAPEAEVLELSAEATREVQIEIPPEARQKKLSSPELLHKKGFRSTFQEAGDYKPGSSGQHHSTDWETEDSTAVLRPDMEAELLLKQGFAQQAMDAFVKLAKSFPDNARFAARAEQIRQMIEKNVTPIPAEVTVRRDISDLRKEARPTGMKIEIPAEVIAAAGRAGRAMSSEWDEEEPTMVEAKRKRMEKEAAERAAAERALADKVRADLAKVAPAGPSVSAAASPGPAGDPADDDADAPSTERPPPPAMEPHLDRAGVSVRRIIAIH